MNNLEEQADNARELFWKPLSWLGAIRPTSANDAFDPALWETFVCLAARPAEQGVQRCPGRQQTWRWSFRRQRDG